VIDIYKEKFSIRANRHTGVPSTRVGALIERAEEVGWKADPIFLCRGTDQTPYCRDSLASGLVTVTESLPIGLTLASMTGPGWTCTSNTLTCTRSDVLTAGASYPAITVTVTVANNAISPLMSISSIGIALIGPTWGRRRPRVARPPRGSVAPGERIIRKMRLNSIRRKHTAYGLGVHRTTRRGSGSPRISTRQRRPIPACACRASRHNGTRARQLIPLRSDPIHVESGNGASQ